MSPEYMLQEMNNKERNCMLSEAKLKKYRKIKEGPKNLNFGVSKPGVKRGWSPGPLGSAPGISQCRTHFLPPDGKGIYCMRLLNNFYVQYHSSMVSVRKIKLQIP